MFFQGTLQDGITAAVQQSKLVVCFVTDGQDESQKWESDYLTENTIAALLEKDAVTLRLEAGSQEAGYLAAIFPIPKTPVLVIIRNGELKEYIAAGVTKEDFVRRVNGALQAPQSAVQTHAATTTSDVSGAASVATSTPQAEDAAATETSSAAEESSGPAGVNTPASTTLDEQAEAELAAPSQPPARMENSRHTQGREQALAQAREAQARVVAEQAEQNRRRVQAALRAKKEREEIERQRKTKRDEEERAKKPKTSDSVSKASQQLAERRRHEREERQRVLRLIEDDKAERRARREERKAEREAERKAHQGDSSASPSAAPASQIRRRHDQCNLQVRLFDGSMIRTRMSSKSTIKDVRKWTDETRKDGSQPYTFKIILTPLPNRNIDATEESRSVEDLELTPSSTLVLIPVDKYSAAYAEAEMSPISRFIAAILAFFASIIAAISNFFFRPADPADPSGPHAPGQELRGQPPVQTTENERSRIKGFQNPDDRRRDQQFYNGNSLNFEPRDDDDDQKK